MVSYYNVKETDTCRPGNFPHVVDELTALREGLVNMPVQQKSAIVLSYLKDHCIMIEWIAANPTLVAQITSNTYKTAHIESLFGSARNHKIFLHDFEVYLKHQLDPV